MEGLTRGLFSPTSIVPGQEGGEEVVQAGFGKNEKAI